MGGKRHAFGGDPRKAPPKRDGIEQFDRAALALLNGVVGAQHGFAGGTGEEQIARLLQPQIDAQELGRAAQEADAVA